VQLVEEAANAIQRAGGEIATAADIRSTLAAVRRAA